jgi:hypothetical protein
MMEKTPDSGNAEGAITLTESERVKVDRQQQQLKRKLGIFDTRDGVSNVRDDNSQHRSKRESPRVETDEGSMKDVRL